VLVKVREWIGPALASPDFMLDSDLWRAVRGRGASTIYRDCGADAASFGCVVPGPLDAPTVRTSEPTEPALELAQIRYFAALCSERNFTRAARRCGVSQPSLSNGVKAVECELGGKLFERPDMSLTPLGKSLRLYFESAVASVRQITRRAMAFHRRQLVQRRVAAARNLRLLDPVVPLSGARCFEEATQGETAHDRHSRENLSNPHIVDLPKYSTTKLACELHPSMAMPAVEEIILEIVPDEASPPTATSPDHVGSPSAPSAGN